MTRDLLVSAWAWLKADTPHSDSQSRRAQSGQALTGSVQGFGAALTGYDRSVRVLIWDVHGGYSDALLHVPHQFWYCRDDTLGQLGSLTANGLGRRRDDRPANAAEVTIEQLRDDPPDIVIAQRLEEVDALECLLRRRPGRDFGAVFLEHNTPKGGVPDSRHPLADQQVWHLVHVTHFNRHFWDCGNASTRVIEHGLPDPGHRYTGELDRLAFVVNEPVRRWRTTGTDLLPAFGDIAIDAFGIDGDRLPSTLGSSCPRLSFGGNLSPAELDDAVARRRGYLHLTRWTSLGLSLINSMMLGLPVIAFGTTEAFRAVPPTAGVCSTDLAELAAAANLVSRDRAQARAWGEAGRVHALQRFSLDRFVHAWNACLSDVAG
ncbi:MAG: glycosyltransferase family 1 protein [Microlunatus sp.]|nr:glycosyltransferase family 1 protein [Microlunatus sp.]MDN5803057.1 glycosyltransferase family 1 protein [Microlunatus sp.]